MARGVYGIVARRSVSFTPERRAGPDQIAVPPFSQDDEVKQFRNGARILIVLSLGLIVLAGVQAAGRRAVQLQSDPPSASVATTTTLDWEHKGFNVPTWTEEGLYDSGPALEQLASIGANSVGFAPYWYQSTLQGNALFRMCAG